jgi:hypothetical protein
VFSKTKEHPTQTETMFFPSWEDHATQDADSANCHDLMHLPVETSHIRKMLSADPDINHCPEMCTATERTLSECPKKVKLWRLGNGFSSFVVGKEGRISLC